MSRLAFNAIAVLAMVRLAASSLVTLLLVALNSGAAASFISHRTQNGAISTRSLMRLDMSVPNVFDTTLSGLASVARLPNGVEVSKFAKSPLEQVETGVRLLVLYDVENSRDCRAVREKITELDLVVETVVPSAEESRVFSDPSYAFALPISDESIVPRLVVLDRGKEKALAGEDILPYLEETFSVGDTTASEEINDKIIGILYEVGFYLASALRFSRGTKVCSAAASSNAEVPRPAKPLILYSYEGNQFCRLVREVLTELDIPYELKSVGKGSPRRADMAKITGGSTQCPYLIDPSTKTTIFESADIIKYLYSNYALWTPPNEILQAASAIVTPLLKPIYKELAPLQAGSIRDDSAEYLKEITEVKALVEEEISSNPVVVYTYSLSPFCTEAKELMDNLDINYKEISLGSEWIPGLISEEGTKKRVALGELTGQTSLPHIFVGGESIGGIFSGTPGLLPSLEQGRLLKMVQDATAMSPAVKEG